MTPKSLCPELAVDKQITPADVAAAKAQGFRSIINNRPDDEEPGQPASAEIAEAAEAAGLAYVHIPVVPGQISEADIAAFDKALETLPHPILGFCRTGTRASMLWALCRCGSQGPDAVCEVALKAGYDLSAIKPRLQQRATRG
jgi:sulfide:quinone oxidoreductase